MITQPYTGNRDDRPLWITGVPRPDSRRSLRQAGYPQLLHHARGHDPVYTKHPRGLAGAHPLDMTRPPNPCVQLHPIHPPRLPVRATLTEGYTRSHFGPPQPDRPAASVGDYCSAVLTPLPADATLTAAAADKRAAEIRVVVRVRMVGIHRATRPRASNHDMVRRPARTVSVPTRRFQGVSGHGRPIQL